MIDAPRPLVDLAPGSADVAADTVAVVSPGADCAGFAAGWCARQRACAPYSLESSFGTEATCRTRMALWCGTYLGGPAETGWTPVAFRACIDGMAALACEPWRASIFFLKGPACQVKGRRPTGAACSVWTQCDGLNCSFGATGACGRCAPLAPLGGACVDDDECADGLQCPNKVCVAPGGLGTVCDANRPCSRQFVCLAGLCARRAGVGAPCTSHDQCDEQALALCNFATGKCGRAVASPTMCDANRPDGTVLYCGNGGSCASNKTCVADAAEGGACVRMGDGAGCTSPAFCSTISSTCVLPQPAVCTVPSNQDGGTADTAPLVTLDQACDEWAATSCTKLRSCSQNFFYGNFGADDACRGRFVLLCRAAATAPGSGLTPAALRTCSASRGMLGCSEFLETNSADLPGCASSGARAAGMRCYFHAQCASQSCFFAQGATCGVCRARADVGGACSQDDSHCARGLICSEGSACVMAAQLLAPCDAQRPCRRSLSCRNGICQRPGELGAACTEHPQCNTDGGLACNPATSTCGRVIWGATCDLGRADGSLMACASAGVCQLSGACAPHLLDNAACGDTVAGRCLFPTVCDNGTCRVDANQCLAMPATTPVRGGGARPLVDRGVGFGAGSWPPPR